MKSDKVNLGKKVASIAGIVIAAMLVIFAFCGRFCNTETSQGFMHFANFFVGAFGMAFYGMMAAVIVACAFVLAGKNIRIPAKYVIHFILMFVAAVLLVHLLTTTYLPKDFNQHISLIYHYYDNQMGVPSFGGVVFGLVAWCLKTALSIWGASIVVVALLIWTIYVAGDFFYKYATGKLSLVAKSTKEDIEPTKTTNDAKDKSVYSDDDPRRKAYEILFMDQEASVSPEVVSQKETSVAKFPVADQSKLDNEQKSSTRVAAEQILFSDDGPSSQSDKNAFFAKEPSSQKKDDEYLVKGYYQSAKKTEEKPVEPSTDWKISFVPEAEPKDSVEQVKVEQMKEEIKEQPKFVGDQPILQQHIEPQPQNPQYTENVVDNYAEELDITDITVDAFTTPIAKENVSACTDDSFVVEKKQPEVKHSGHIAPAPFASDDGEDYDGDEIVAVMGEDEVDGGMQVKFDLATKEEVKKAESIHHYMEYNIPPMDLLNDITIVEDHDDGERQRLAQAIVNKLAVFNIKIELADIIVGPSVTRYMFTVLSQKTRMSDFKQYSDDIKACVEAQEDIIIEAPVKGTNMVGIEVANKNKRPVVLRALLDTPDFQNAKGDLVFAIGQEITGKVVLADLADMPHLLIAGTTGSGKSVCLNCLIVSLMYKYGPEYLRFVMVDPKFVELSRYEGIPHMLTAEAITTMQDALAGMDYLISEMETRYQLFRQNGVDKISEYNKRINPKLAQKLPYLIFIVDELADLMATNKSAFEAKLMRLAQKARAAGIHIVLATQRPDVKVITGTIKGNLPCRMALKVSSVYDSQTIIGGGGAEKLLGKGDMLFMNSSGSSDLTRVQGAYVSNDEIRSIVKYSKEVNEVYYDESVTGNIFVSKKAEDKVHDDESDNESESGKDELYPYYKKALRYWLERNGGKASISSLQRGISVGFNRAGRIMESLQKLGYVEEPASSETSSRALKVLVTLEELDGLFPDVED